MTDVMLIPYQLPVVRDLAWVMASPGLLQVAPDGQTFVSDEWCQQVYAKHKSHLCVLDKNPEPLLQSLARSKSHRLGIYFEWLLRYWLEDILKVKQLQHNVPVFQSQKKGGKRTLGEFDFLFRVEEGQPLQQWEATVKFYLQKLTDQGDPYWIGPGDQDRLDIKLNRLFQHQLKLSELPEAKECVPEIGNDFVHPAGFIKGYLFYQLSEDDTFASHTAADVTLSPCKLSPAHNKGWWFHWGERLLPGASPRTRWVILVKPRWLSSACQSHITEHSLDTAGLETYCEKYFCLQSRPLLVAELQQLSGIWLEASRGFVLPPQ